METFNLLGAITADLLTLMSQKLVFLHLLKTKEGSYNFFKPNYSSFKLGGIQVRGKNAATFQMIYMVLILIVNSIKILWHLSVSFLWFGFLATKWLVDFSIGFVKGFKTPAQ